MLERIELEAFLTLAEELHFGRTAARLRVTTGRISQTIKKVERRIGAPLFERTSRQVTLTEVGRQLYDDLRAAQEQMDAGLNRAISAGRIQHGVLRVGFSAPWCGDLVVRAADQYRVRHPGREVHIQEIQLIDPFGPMRAGEIDLQLTEFPVREPDITVGRVVFSESRSLMVPVDHPFARMESLSWEDLADAVLIGIKVGPAPEYWADYHYPRWTPSGRPVPHGHSYTYWQEALDQVAVGNGVTVASARAERYHTRPGMAYVPFRDAPTIDYGLLWPVNGETWAVKEFIQLIDVLGPPRSGEPKRELV